MATAEPLYYLPLERYASTTKDSSSGRVYCATDAQSPQWRFTRLAIVLSCLVAIIANPCSTRICNYENICLAQLFNCKQAFANMQDYCFVAFNNLQLWECVFFIDSFDSMHSQLNMGLIKCLLLYVRLCRFSCQNIWDWLFRLSCFLFIYLFI